MGLFGGNTDTGAEELIKNLEMGKTAYQSYMNPISDFGTSGYRKLGNLLGVGSKTDIAASYDQFYNSPGIQFAQEEAARATQRQMGAMGMGNSGNILAALQERSMGLAGQQFSGYLSQLGSFAQPGLQAAQNLADMSYNFYQQKGQAEAAQAAADASGGFDLGSALGGAISGFATGGWGGAALGALGGGATGNSGFGSLLGGLGGGGSLNSGGSNMGGFTLGGMSDYSSAMNYQSGGGINNSNLMASMGL